MTLRLCPRKLAHPTSIGDSMWLEGTVAYSLKARTVEAEKQLLLENGSETKFVFRQRLGKHVPAATDTHATIEVLLKTVFSTRSVQRGYREDNWGNRLNKDLVVSPRWVFYSKTDWPADRRS
jgi:hypothetical protein